MRNFLSKTAIGTVQFGMAYGVSNKTHASVPKSEINSILNEAMKDGVHLLDTAKNYGSSEKLLGEIGVKGWSVVSKLPKLPDNCVNVEVWVEEQINVILNNLGCDCLYGLLLHHPQDLFSVHGPELIKSLQNLKNKNKTKKIGYSVYSPVELEKCFLKIKPEIVQFPYNVFDKRFENTSWIDILHNEGIETHVRSVFLQGLLLMKPQDRPEFFAQWKSHFEKWENYLQQTSQLAIEAALRFVFSNPKIDRVIIGMQSLEEWRGIRSAIIGISHDITFPDFSTIDEKLINPAQWG